MMFFICLYLCYLLIQLVHLLVLFLLIPKMSILCISSHLIFLFLWIPSCVVRVQLFMPKFLGQSRLFLKYFLCFFDIDHIFVLSVKRFNFSFLQEIELQNLSFLRLLNQIHICSECLLTIQPKLFSLRFQLFFKLFHILLDLPLLTLSICSKSLVLICNPPFLPTFSLYFPHPLGQSFIIKIMFSLLLLSLEP